VHARTHACMHACLHVYEWRSEENSGESVLSFYKESPQGQTLVLGFRSSSFFFFLVGVGVGWRCGTKRKTLEHIGQWTGWSSSLVREQLCDMLRDPGWVPQPASHDSPPPKKGYKASLINTKSIYKLDHLPNIYIYIFFYSVFTLIMYVHLKLSSWCVRLR
jgi:hypothetical protein